MEWLCVDRIEGEFAVCENHNREMKNIPLREIERLPAEGDLLFFADGQYRISAEETEKRRQEVLRLQQKLFRD